jgi:GH25 family lysozyme M1 (1,4-beta-N-acetylmuramidase)
MHIPSPRARALTAALGIALAAITAGALAVPAAASDSLPTNPASDPALMAYISSHDTPMGAEIRAHESTSPGPVSPMVTQTPGLDVSGYQGNVNWSTVSADGAKFVYIKATEDTDYTNPYFSQQYDGSYNVGIIRGSYHYAHPNDGTGATQAAYFIAHGGGWSSDGKTLPGAIDMEWGTSAQGGDCWGISQSAMASFITSFANYYDSHEGVYPVIYTSTSWWSECVGTAANYSGNDPLWVARYASSVGSLPYNWGFQTIWQYADSGTFPGDQDYFNGPYSGVQALANG